MAFATTNIAPVSGLLHKLEKAYDWLARVAENSPRGRAVAALNKVSDEELKALGTTRAKEARRLFSAHYYI